MNNSMTPREIVEHLNKFIIGQDEAKKMVAIALRNRYRAKQLPPEMREEYVPKNLMLMGPTGVGKTELARRMAKLVNAPFIKVEATKFTEVGYVGRDVDSMIRDLVEASIRMHKEQEKAKQTEKAKDMANLRILDLLWPKKAKKETRNPMEIILSGDRAPKEEAAESTEEMSEKRKEFLEKIKNGLMDEREVDIEVEESMQIGNFMAAGGDNNGMQDMLGAIMPKRKKKRHTTVGKARKIFMEEESQKLLDMDAIQEQAIEAVEQDGIVFIDEFDKIAVTSGQRGPDVSREGVQRDILPIVEGATVNTKYGPVKTEHILFIAAGAFHLSKPSDLIPELQGRFPIRVELTSLTKEDFKAILTTPEQALLKQYHMLLKADNVTVQFTEEAIDKIAELAYRVNNETEDIGARRLHTILEKLLQDISYNAPAPTPVEVKITPEMVEARLGGIVSDVDLSNYIL